MSQVYKWTDAQCERLFSDHRAPGADPFDIVTKTTTPPEREKARILDVLDIIVITLPGIAVQLRKPLPPEYRQKPWLVPCGLVRVVPVTIWIPAAGRSRPT